MTTDVQSFHDHGLSPWDTMLRIVETADRLHDLADAAEARGRLTDATRATLAESRVLHQLLSLGVAGDREVNYAEDAAELERAVARLIRRAPAAGDVVADSLESRGRGHYAAAVRGLVARVREHQRQELSGADH